MLCQKILQSALVEGVEGFRTSSDVLTTDEDLRNCRGGHARTERRPNFAAPVPLLIFHRVEVDRAVGNSELTKHLPHRPAELTPLECEHDDRLLRIADDLGDEFLRSGGHLLLFGGGLRGRSGWRCVESIARGRLGDLDLLGGHALCNFIKERGAQVAFAGVRQHAQHRAPLRCRLADLQRPRQGGAPRDTGEDPLQLSQLLGEPEGIGPGDGHE